MPDPVTLAIIGTNLISAFGSNSSSKKASRANRRANQLEAERRGVQNSLARRKALAERRRLQASVRAEALATGVGLSSAANAAEASIDAQTASEVGSQRQLEAIDIARDAEIRQSQKAQTQAGNFAAAGSLVTSVFGSLGGGSSGGE